MSNFEEQLARALARQNPAPDFTERVVRATVVKQRRPFWKRWTARILMWRLAPALAALLVVGTGAFFQEHQRIEQGKAAKRELLTAMRIASDKLHAAEQRVISLGE